MSQLGQRDSGMALEAVQCYLNTILMRVKVLLTKLVKSVNALRAERLLVRLNSPVDVDKGIQLG
jgi:hypothetical protein